jgi:hypothetical protein
MEVSMAKDNIRHLRGDNDDGDDPDGGADAGAEGSDQSLEELEAARQRAAEEEAERQREQEEADGQFALEIPTTGRKITLGTMVPRGTPVELKYKMSGKSIPNVRGGLPDPADLTGLLLVTFLVEDVDTKFTRDGTGKIEKATIYVTIGPKHVVNARSEAGEVLLRGESEAA